MEMSDKIRILRKNLNLTLEEVGKTVGVGKSTVRKWENGDIANMRRDKIAKLAEALHCTPSYLMGWDDLPKNTYSYADLPDIPVLGVIHAGRAIFAEENIEGYEKADVRNPDEYFFLRVQGDCMVNVGITEGSRVLIHKQNYADNGDIVACIVDGDDATLKRFQETKDMVILKPANPAYEPIAISKHDFDDGEARILGVAKRVVTDL